MIMQKRFLIVAILFILIITIIVFFISSFHLIDSYGIECDKLLSVEEVQNTFIMHQNTIAELEKLDNANSNIWLEVDTDRCASKADIVIYYGT